MALTACTTQTQQTTEEEETNLSMLILSEDLHHAGTHVRARQQVPPRGSGARLAL